MNRLILAGLLLAFTAAVAPADVPTAEKYVAEAKEKLTEREDQYNREDARKKLELAELELKDVTADAKKPVVASIAALRKEIDTKEAEHNLKLWRRDLKLLLDDADKNAGNLVLWPVTEKRFEEFAKKPGVADALGDDLKEARKRIESIAKLYDKNKTTQTAEGAERLVKLLETKWAERKEDAAAFDRSNARARAVEDTERDIAQLTKELKDLPADHPTRKAVEPRVKKVADELRATAGGGLIKDVVRRLNDSWDLDARETTGWEEEAADVTFERYMKEQSDKMSAFGAPKTVELRKVSAQWLKYRDTDREYQSVKDAVEVSVAFNAVKNSHDKAVTRLEAAAETIVGQAEKTPISDRNLNAFERLTSDLRVSLGDSDKSKALQARVQKVIDQAGKAAVAAEEAKTGWYTASTKQAAAKWPELKAKYSAGTGFDPTQASGAKGKLFTVTTDNLMGYGFKPGDFPFATTINGHAVAAKYDPVVAGGIEEVQKKLGRDLGDDDNDGKWEVVIRVEGTTGRLMARKQVEGDLTLNGNKVGTYRGEYSEPTDAAIVTIVAAKCGPLAVSADAGMVTESGETQKVVGSDPKTQAGGGSGWTGYGIFGSLLRFVIGLSTAVLCLLFAGWKPLAKIPAAGGTFEKLAKPLGAVGAVAVLFGFYWLGINLFRGFGGAFVFLAAGGFVVLLTLNKLGVVKAELADKVKPFGAIVGFACAGVTLVSMVSQGHLWVL